MGEDCQGTGNKDTNREAETTERKQRWGRGRLVGEVCVCVCVCVGEK